MGAGSPRGRGDVALIHRGADGEVGSAGTRLGRARGRVNREDDRGGRWVGPGRVGRGPGGGQGLSHPFAFPFPLFLFILSYFILVTFYFSFSKNYH